MKTLITCLFLITSLSLSAQKIEYSIPEGYESDISKKDYKFLVKESVKAISQYYKIVSVKEGAVELEEGQDFAILNLHNLILRCAEEERENWATMINEHFDGIYQSVESQKQLDVSKFETVSDYLSIRIYPESFVMQYGGTANMIVRTHLEGTFSLLMLDLPSAFTPVQKEVFKLWDKSEDEVFEIAQRNVNKQESVKVTEPFEVKESTIEVHFLENEDYGASLGLDLENNAPEFLGEWGAVIAIPNKGIINVCKVSKENPVDFVLFIQKFQAVVEQFYQQHSQPVSTDFFWYYQGEFTKIKVLNVNGDIQVISPQGLTQLMVEEE